MARVRNVASRELPSDLARIYEEFAGAYGPFGNQVAVFAHVPAAVRHLMPLLIEYSAFWRFNSWDGFAVPKPFSRVTVTILPLVQVGVSENHEAFEEKRKQVETLMTKPMVMR